MSETPTSGAGGEMDAPAAAAPAAPAPPPGAPEPKYKRIDMPTQDDMIMQDFMNNCAVKTVLATVMGGFLGAAMGVFFGAFDPMTPTEGEKQTIVQQLKKAGRSTLSKSYSYAKGFAAFGALYSGSECVFRADAGEARHLQQRVRGVFHGGRHGSVVGAARDGDGVRDDGRAVRVHG